MRVRGLPFLHAWAAALGLGWVNTQCFPFLPWWTIVALSIGFVIVLNALAAVLDIIAILGQPVEEDDE